MIVTYITMCDKMCDICHILVTWSHNIENVIESSKPGNVI